MEYTIKDLELLSGIKAHTIRIWEQRYSFLKPLRTETNIRRYNKDELKELLTVALLNKFGYKISKIGQMTRQQRTEAVIDLPVDEAIDESIVFKLISYMVDLDHRSFEEQLTKHISKHGFKKTITGVVFSFLEKVGMLWHTSHIMPAQEHVVSNIIRQKIIAAIETLPLVKKTQPLFVLFLPEGEFHELGLLYVYYLLRNHRLPVIYMGADVPLTDIDFVVKTKMPQYIYLHLTAFPHTHHFQSFLEQLSGYKQCRVLISGTAASSAGHMPANINFLSSLSAVSHYISSVK